MERFEVSYRRWYDTDPRLSAVVRTMECMGETIQRQFAEKLLELSEEWMLIQGGNAYLSALDTKKQDGLQKSHAKKRWYDQYETLHKAFNNLYALDEFSRRSIAEKLSLPIEIVKGYEQHCQEMDKKPEMSVIDEVLRTCFKERPERARRLYSVYLPEFNQALRALEQERHAHKAYKGVWETLLESIQSALKPT
jgi:hypothetical protein